MIYLNKDAKSVIRSQVDNIEFLYQAADIGVDFSSMIDSHIPIDEDVESSKNRTDNESNSCKRKRSKKAKLHDLSSFALVSIYKEKDLLKALEMMEKRYK